MKSFGHLALVATLLTGLPSPTCAASLKVAPARFIIHNVEPGRIYDVSKETGLSLTIFNDDEVEKTWTLSTYRPSERGKWEKGYSEIPDSTWCWFAEKEITVPPKGRSQGELFIQIPDEERYYNQHWVVTLGVGGPPGSRGISLAVDVRVQIETASKSSVAENPAGDWGATPSLSRINRVSAGKTYTGEFELYNNRDREESFSFSSLFLEGNFEKSTYLTGSYQVIPDHGWIVFPDLVPVPPKSSKTVHFEASIPAETQTLPNKWEEILLVKPSEGQPGFVRIQLETTN